MTKQERYDRQSEAFEVYGRREDAAKEIGEALAHAAYERGERLTEDERRALDRDLLHGQSAAPVCKRGRKWALDHGLARGFGLFETKAKAEDAWRGLIWKWIRLGGLEGRDLALADLAARQAYLDHATA